MDSDPDDPQPMEEGEEPTEDKETTEGVDEDITIEDESGEKTTDRAINETIENAEDDKADVNNSENKISDEESKKESEGSNGIKEAKEGDEEMRDDENDIDEVVMDVENTTEENKGTENRSTTDSNSKDEEVVDVEADNEEDEVAAIDVEKDSLQDGGDKNEKREPEKSKPKELTQSSEKNESTSGSVEVVQLDNQDDTDVESLPTHEETKKAESSDSSIEYTYEKKKRKIVWQCINPKCSTLKRRDLKTASTSVLAMYNYDMDPKKKRKICYKCDVDVEKEMSRLIAKIDKGELLVTDELSIPEDVMELEDSDEKSETDDSMSSDVEFSVSSGDENLPINKLIEKKLGKEFDLSKVISESAAEISKGFAEVEVGRMEAAEELKKIEKAAEKLRSDLYKPFEPKIESLPELDLNLEEEMASASLQRPHQVLNPAAAGNMIRPRGEVKRPIATKSMGPRPLFRPGYSAGPMHQQGVAPSGPFVPPQGPLKKPPLTLGAPVFHLRGGSTVNIWKPGSVEEILSTIPGEPQLYKIKFENVIGNKKHLKMERRNLKQLAYSRPAMVKIMVGTRVIALYHEMDGDQGAFYAGIIAEPPKTLNNSRYLVFFDDGVARYVEHKDVRVICHSSSDVADDVHPNSRDFIREYLKRYPERPMVKLTVGQVVKTEYEGKWHITRVNKVDASLVRLLFEQENRFEWVYRGSTRLGPLFTELENQRIRKEDGKSQGLLRRRVPGSRVEYTSQMDTASPSSGGGAGGGGDAADSGPKKHNVARKTGGARRPDQNTANSMQWDKEGNIIQVEINSRRIRGKPFSRHNCGSRCYEHQYVESEWRGTNPLLIPLMLGWDRQIHKLQGKLTNKVQNKTVSYVAPCGRSLRNLEEVLRYLRITGSSLEIDFFNMDWFVKVFDEWTPKRTLSQIPDLSYGKENVPVPCINSVDNSFPDFVEYSTVRIPKDRVNINTDEEFLVGCDCNDDCQDINNCSCHRLTIQATAHCVRRKVNPNAVYKFRRLMEFVPTGIYECNKMCKCAKTCLNRVAQNPLRNKLQVFKTDNRDWGVRTLCDIPKGGFICIYVGNLFDIEESNRQGKDFGDEYFADLDLIEMVEKQKEGYEEDVEEPDDFEPFFPTSMSKSPESMSTDEDYDPASPEDKDYKDYKVRKRDSHVSKSSDRLSRSKISQVDGGDTTSSSEDERSAVYINDLIDKPDPFASRMVVRKKWSEVKEDDILVQHPSQVDGGADESDDDDYEILEERQPLKSGFSAPSGMMGPKLVQDKFKSTRKFFGAEEEAYTMDAKSIGNIGRYLNHCCEPNCFVQSVFVDTHDLRFHWVAFFAHCHISAGTELHWDYNYEPGQIPNRELICRCSAEKCRGRLL